MPDPQIQAEIRYSPQFRLVNGLGVLVFLGMAFIGWMAYSQEEAEWALPTAVVLLALGLFWLFTLAASPQVVQFGKEQLMVRRWLGRASLAYRDISAVRQSRPFITITTPNRTIRLYKLHANSDALLMAALEKFVPVAHAVQQCRLHPTLPFTFHSSWTGPIGVFIGALMLLGGGIGSFVFFITENETAEPLQRMCAPLFSLMSLIFGLTFLYMLVRQFPRKYVFTPAEIRLHYLFHAARYPTQGLLDVGVTEVPRTVRGVPRTVYHLELRYANRFTLVLEPNCFGFPIDYVDAKEARTTAELAAQIHHAYKL